MSNFQLMNGNQVLADLRVTNSYVEIVRVYTTIPQYLENIND